jgi:hypothetical protein
LGKGAIVAELEILEGATADLMFKVVQNSMEAT